MEKFLTNKYFCLAILIALVVMVFLYSQKTDSCRVEGMQGVDLSMLAPELTENPWTDNNEGGNYKYVGDKFDFNADATVKANLTKEGYKYTNFAGRLDQDYEKYVAMNPIRQRNQETNIPLPMDTRPDLSQCQPCRCDGRSAIYEDTDSSEEYVPRKRSQKRTHRRYI